MKTKTLIALLICLDVFAVFDKALIKAQVEKPDSLQLTDTKPHQQYFLEEVSINALEDASRIQNLAGSFVSLNNEAIVSSNGVSLSSLLNSLPGVSMQSGTYATSRLVIRGMGSRTPYNTNRIRAYLNEIPLTSADGVSAPEEIDLLSLQRIEIVKGPSAVLYGSGLGGSLNLYTPEASENSGQASVQYSSFNTLNARISGTKVYKNAGLTGSIGHLQSDGYRENSNLERTSILTTADADLGKWKLDFLLLGNRLKSGIPSSLNDSMFSNSPAAAAPNWLAANGYKHSFKGVSGLTASRKLNENISNRFIVYGKWYDNYERRPFNNLDDANLSAGIRNKLLIHREKTDWIAGMEWNNEQYSWTIDKADSVYDRNKETRMHYGIYGMVYFRPTEKLKISAAMAVNKSAYRLNDLYPANGNQSGTHAFPLMLSPRLGMNYAVSENFSLYASAGHGYSLPSPEETLLPEGEVNKGIKPEQGFQMEGGIRLLTMNKKLEMDLGAYWIELSDLLVTKRLSDELFTGINAGKTRHMGVEALVHARLFSNIEFPGSLTARLNFTIGHHIFTRFTDDGINYNSRMLPGIPAHQTGLQLEWAPHRKVQLMSEFRITGEQYLDDLNRLNEKGYFLWNMNLRACLWELKAAGLYLNAGINNITNTRYASMVVVNALPPPFGDPRYYYPGEPTNGYLGVSVDF